MPGSGRRFETSFMSRCGLSTQDRMNRFQQGDRAVRLGHQRVYTLQRILRQVHFAREHDDGNTRFYLLDRRCHNSAIQTAELVVQHNCIHRVGHEKQQTLVATGRGHKFVMLLQLTQFAWVPVYAK